MNEQQPMEEVKRQHALQVAQWCKGFCEQFNVNVILSPVELSPDVAEFCRDALLGLAESCQSLVDKKK